MLLTEGRLAPNEQPSQTLRLFVSYSATQRGATRRAAWKAKWVTSAVTIWCRFRRRRTWEELNQYLRSCCQQDEQRRIAGKTMPVGEAMRIEREHLLPLAAKGFELNVLELVGWPTPEPHGGRGNPHVVFR